MKARIVFISIVLVSVMLVMVFLKIKDKDSKGAKNMDKGSISSSGFELVSPAFRDGASIPTQYSCQGQNVSPPLSVIKVPAKTKSLALIMHDPDAPSGDYIHWTMWDIPADTENLPANSVPVGAVQGLNGSGQNKYMGPCPPSGTHHYEFELYALDKSLGLKPKTTRDELKNAMEGHVLGEHTLTGLFSS